MLRMYFLSLLFLSVASSTALGQISQGYLNDIGSTSYGINIPVENGFINISNGNLHLEFPLASHPQRGSLALNERITYDSRFWNFLPFGSNGSYHWWPYNVPGTTHSSGGWKFISGLETGTISYQFAADVSKPVFCQDSGYSGQDQEYVMQLIWTDSSGTVHPFNAGYTTIYDPCSNTNTQTTPYFGLASDGSGYSSADDGTGSPIITDNSGTEVYPQIIDRYGNYFSADGNGNLKDDTGRVPVIVTQNANGNANVTWYDVLASNGTPDASNQKRVRYIVTIASIPVATNFRSFADSDIYPWNPSVQYLTPIKSIQLPDGSQYTFGYDSTGEMSSITLPTGGVVAYGYSNFLDSSNTENRWLVSRTQGSNPAMTFTPSVVTGCSNYSTGCVEQVNLHKPSGDETVYQLTLVNGAWNTGVTTYTGSAANGQKLSQTTNMNTYTNGCISFYPCSGANYVSQTLATTALFSNPSGTAIYTETLSDFVSTIGKISDVKEWDYVSSSPNTSTPPTTKPTRTTQYSYTGKDLYQVTVLDSGGNPAGLTTYGYTSTAASTSNVTQHGSQNAGGPYLQTISHWLNTDPNNPLVTTYAMDDSGQVLTTIDPKNYTTATMTYQCANSLPLSAKNALNQTTTYSYDCNSGALTSVQDPNDLAAGRTGTTYAYEATGGRPYMVNYPDGGVTTYSYPSAGEVDTTVLATPNPSLVSKSITDAYGRPYQTIKGDVSSETTYDVNGRSSCVTNTHFSSPSSTDGSTCMTTYDGLDRPMLQTNPDGSTVSWGYSANIVTTTDQSGSSWARTSDAFGHLTKVVEPGGLQTTYTYDGLGNLHTTNQSGAPGETAQTRTFIYDSLSRLTSSTYPESGTTGYTYDKNGNLHTKTDARNVTTTFSYDALNRLTLKQFSDGTHQVAYGYDGRGEDGSVLTTPSLNSIGRMSHSSNQVNAASNYSYDANGRLAHQYVCIPTDCSYNVQAGAQYDLAGNVDSLTYPDGRAISQSYDGTGQLSLVNYAGWNGNSHSSSYFAVNGTNGHDALGHVANASFGNGLGIYSNYNATSRSSTMAYGTPAQLLWGRQYQLYPNGNLQSTVDLSSGVQRLFGYDNLNRLTSAQDVAGSQQGVNTSPFTSVPGGFTGASSGSVAVAPYWTDPDESNLLLNADTPGASGWGVANASIVSGVSAPDSTPTAFTFTANSGSVDTYLTSQASSSMLYDGETMTGSVWLRSPAGNQTVNLYFVELGSAGYNIPAWKPVTVTQSWQQFQLSGQYHYGHNILLFQIGGGATITGGQAISIWGTKLEDSGTSGPTITNFMRYSQRLTGPTWAVRASTATDNFATAPDGTNTAAMVTASGGSNDSWIVDNVPNPAPYYGITLTGSVWLRSPNGPQNILLTLITDNSVPVGGATVSLTSVWQRFQVSAANASTTGELQLQIGGANTFVNGQTIQVWGAQMELGSTAGPYVATAANPVSIGTNLTNLLSFSQQLKGSSWIPIGTNVAANAVPAPDASITGSELTAFPGVSDAYIVNDLQNPALYNGATVTVSAFLRVPSGTQQVALILLAQNASGVTYPVYQMVQATSNWQRFSFTGQLPNGLTRVYLQIGGADTLSSGMVIDVWGSQLELSNHAGPYVATSALPVIAGKELRNILIGSQQLSGPSWGIANGYAADNTVTSPDGTSTAAVVIANSGSPDTFAENFVPNPSLYDTQVVTGSVYLRVPSGTLNLNIYLPNYSNGVFAAPMQQVTLTTTWQRFSITAQLPNGLTNLALQVGGGATFTSGSIQIWGSQLVLGSAAAPYMATPTTTTNPTNGGTATPLTNGLNQAYSYDSFGNLKQNGSFNNVFPSQNQMLGYAYDPAGDLLSDGMTTMSWDGEGKLVSSGGANYIYDAEGNRVEKQGVSVTDTINFGGQPIARLSAGQWTDLIYGPNGLLAEVPGTEYGSPVYRLVDQLGSQIGSSTSNGLLINPMDYTPFGQVFSGSTSSLNMFTGLERDSESGLDHAMYRQYSSTTGRWVSPDPYDGSMDLSNPQSLNRYSYVGNNPLLYTDPLGLQNGDSSGRYPNGTNGGIIAGLLTVGLDALVNKIAGLFYHPTFYGTSVMRPLGLNPEGIPSYYMGVYKGGIYSPPVKFNFTNPSAPKKTAAPAKSDLPNCYLLAFDSLANDLGPTPGPSNFVSATQEALTAVAGYQAGKAGIYALIRGLVVPLRSSIYRGMLQNSRYLEESSKEIGLLYADYALIKAIRVELTQPCVVP